MSAAQLSLLRRIDELRRCQNPETAETWQAVYLKVYGDDIGQDYRPGGGILPLPATPPPKRNPLD